MKESTVMFVLDSLMQAQETNNSVVTTYAIEKTIAKTRSLHHNQVLDCLHDLYRQECVSNITRLAVNGKVSHRFWVCTAKGENKVKSYNNRSKAK